MSWDGMLPPHPCKRCGKPLNADGGHPAELYAGTYTGLCTQCQNTGPYVVKEYGADGAQRISYPPHCPAWRRDREEFIAYPDCRECGGTGRIYVDRGWKHGGPYYRPCDRCLDRFRGHPGRRWAGSRSTLIYQAAQAAWHGALWRAGLLERLLAADRSGEEPPQEVMDLVEDIRQGTIARMRRLQEHHAAVAARRGYW